MTTLLAWVGVDSRRTTSLNLASDSRLSWPDGNTWDFGRKLFASSKQADIFGYCGEAFLPTQALSQVTDLINLGVVQADTPDDKCGTVYQLLQAAIDKYPPAFLAPFSILYGTRIGKLANCPFHLFHFEFDGSTFADPRTIELPNQSKHVITLGSGKSALDDSLSRLPHSDWNGTSRGMFATFCETLSSSNDSKTGGSPQLVSLHRIGPALTFGICANGRASICGITLNDSATLSAVPWYNERLERYDGLERARDAQPHPRP